MTGMESLPPEPVVFLDLWRDKFFLGREFLTWLWISSELDGNLLKIKPQGYIEVWFESRLTLDSGEGADRKVISCQDPNAKWAEAHTGLRQGKKVSRGRLKIRNEDNKEWGLTLSADTLTPQAIKFPKTFSEGEEGVETEVGRFLERVALLNELLALLEALFKNFLNLRLGEDWPKVELPRLNQWLMKQNP
ncbi:MAG: hypothetical protein AMR96_03555 [Candidatus Adiutrix intracellularis]|jgi:hypothetical protein|nr:MAG: hypothetical protein AMR96_03555 [Candidatus Adiutrix intracellularis]MDR2827256.1 hypothetical protein [Candidatus Adiutrix intracellularis]